MVDKHHNAVNTATTYKKQVPPSAHPPQSAPGASCSRVVEAHLFDTMFVRDNYASNEHYWQALLSYAVVCSMQNKPSEAIASMNRAIASVQQVESNNCAFLAYLHIHRGAVQHAHGDYRAAVSDFSEAIALAKQLASANTKAIRAILLWHARSNRSVVYDALGQQFLHYVDMAKVLGMAMVMNNTELAKHQNYYGQGLPSRIAPQLWPKLPLIGNPS